MTAEQYLNIKQVDKVRVIAPKTNINKTTRSTILLRLRDAFTEEMLQYNNQLITMAYGANPGNCVICTNGFYWIPEWIELPYTFKEL